MTRCCSPSTTARAAIALGSDSRRGGLPSQDPLPEKGSNGPDGQHRVLAYDASGERIVERNLTGGTTTFNLRGLDGALLREVELKAGAYEWVKDYIYRDGLLLASQHRTEGHQHYHLDHLGTTRMLTNRCGERVKRYELFPYGDTISAPANDTETRRFTGHQRDLGSPTNTTDDLEYMHARYYGVKMGRFVSVDPGFDVNPQAPRSWNLYAYVRNNPTRYYDKTGEGLVDKLYGTAQGILGSVSWGMMPNTAPSPLDTPDQREGQLWGAALAAWAGLEVGKAGVSIALAGGAGAILTAGEATAVAAPVVATGVAVAGVGAAVVGGATKYFATTQQNPASVAGTQTTSTTLYNKDGVRIDVENPNPSQRPGQVHVQMDGKKYLFDPATRQFKEAPRAVQNLLKNKKIQKAVEKGMDYLEPGWKWMAD